VSKGIRPLFYSMTDDVSVHTNRPAKLGHDLKSAPRLRRRKAVLSPLAKVRFE